MYPKPREANKHRGGRRAGTFVRRTRRVLKETTNRRRVCNLEDFHWAFIYTSYKVELCKLDVKQRQSDLSHYHEYPCVQRVYIRMQAFGVRMVVLQEMLQHTILLYHQYAQDWRIRFCPLYTDMIRKYQLRRQIMDLVGDSDSE